MINSSNNRWLNVFGSSAKELGIGLAKGSSLAALLFSTLPRLLGVIVAPLRVLHDAPKLYRDDAVRMLDKISGFGSELEAAEKVSYSQPSTTTLDTAMTT